MMPPLPHDAPQSASDDAPQAASDGVLARAREAIAGCIDDDMGLTGPCRLSDDAVFNDLACEIYRWQCDRVPVMAAWRKLAAAEEPTHWRRIPALPIAAFRQERVTSAGLANEPAAVWRSSGTTSAEVSSHVLPAADLYDLALLAPALAMLVPDINSDEGGVPRAVVQLAPAASDAPNSSLAHMLDTIRARVDENVEGVSGVFESQGTLDCAAAATALHAAAQADESVLVLGTSFALVALLDEMRAMPVQLPVGSRMMDTGGYKGRSRSVERSELLDDVSTILGIPRGMCENEYGMSELSSQAWLGTIRSSLGFTLDTSPVETVRPPNARWQPPWMRTIVVDPATLTEVDDGEEGLLVHVDLANAYTCSFVRTEDWGRRHGSSYVLLGRAPGVAVRGCSLRLEDLLA